METDSSPGEFFRRRMIHPPHPSDKRDPLAPLKACGVTSDLLEDAAEYIWWCDEQRDDADDPDQDPPKQRRLPVALRKLATALKECGL